LENVTADLLEGTIAETLQEDALGNLSCNFTSTECIHTISQGAALSIAGDEAAASNIHPARGGDSGQETGTVHATPFSLKT
jgi:hypothetical protein